MEELAPDMLIRVSAVQQCLAVPRGLQGLCTAAERGMGDNTEEKRMNVYVLTSGQYSDHRVKAVFSTEALAINYAEGVDNVNLPPEEYEVDALKPTLKRFWMVDFPSEGEIRISRGKWRDPDQLWQREEIVSGRKKGALHIYLFADTKERALNVASERRAQYLAEHA